MTCRLAAFICGYTTVTIVISGNYSLSNFREDLQKMYKRAGLKGEGLMFLFTDSQIVDERMLVYVNDLLASGEIPDLFAQVRQLGWAFCGKVRAKHELCFCSHMHRCPHSACRAQGVYAPIALEAFAIANRSNIHNSP